MEFSGDYADGLWTTGRPGDRARVRHAHSTRARSQASSVPHSPGPRLQAAWRIFFWKDGRGKTITERKLRFLSRILCIRKYIYIILRGNSLEAPGCETTASDSQVSHGRFSHRPPWVSRGPPTLQETNRPRARPRELGGGPLASELGQRGEARASTAKLVNAVEARLAQRTWPAPRPRQAWALVSARSGSARGRGRRTGRRSRGARRATGRCRRWWCPGGPGRRSSRRGPTSAARCGRCCASHRA